MENLRWIAAAALSAYACHLAVHHTTPIDRALPFLAVAVTLLAWLSYSQAIAGVPLLIAAEIAVANEPMRLLAFGAIVAAVVACCELRGCEEIQSGAGCARDEARCQARRRGDAGTSRRRRNKADGRAAPQHGSLWISSQPLRVAGAFSRGRNPEPATRNPAPLIALLALLLLRWLPLESVQVGRELFLLAIAVATVFVLGRTPFAVAVAVITALATPAIPLRTLAVPLAVLLIAAAARTVGMPAIRLTWPSTVVVAFVMLFFPWSGIVARAFPYFLRVATPERPRTVVAQALAPSRSATYDVPDGATSLIVSGANVAYLRRGAILGRIEPGAIDVRIGEVADWGYLRREAWHHAHNPLPRDAAGKVRDYGYAAWIDGGGRVPLPRGVRTIRVTADGALPADASLQVEGFE